MMTMFKLALWFARVRFHEKKHEMLMREYRVQYEPYLVKRDQYPMVVQQQIMKAVQQWNVRVNENMREWRTHLEARNDSATN